MFSENGCLFLGFPDLDQLVERPIADRNVYAMTVLRRDVGNAVGSAQEHLVVQAVLPGRIVGYVKHLLGSYTLVGGRPVDELVPMRMRKRGTSAIACVRAWLEARGLTAVEATFAYPRHFEFLTGCISFLELDPEADSYRIKGGSAEPIGACPREVD